MEISNGPEESDLPEICVREQGSGFIMQSNLIKTWSARIAGPSER